MAAPPFTPAEVRHFYGVDTATFNGAAATGAGQTIALIDYENDPNIQGDLATFDTEYGLPAPPSLVVESQTGSTTDLPADTDADDGVEEALDVEWSHAMAPAANLVVIETDFYQYEVADLWAHDYVSLGVGRADQIPGVSVVSMSYGVPDFSGESSDDPYFTTPGITYVASTGDNGSAGTTYPATSPDVVAVGGTSIVTSDASGSYGSESVWNNDIGATGGGISGGESKPTYQSGVTQSGTQRTAPDVSIIADPGVCIYDSYEYGGVLEVGGTSLSAPCWAGLIADTDQGRAVAGLSPLTGSTQTLPRLYDLPSTDFHDITTGNNNYQSTGGYSAAAGYDLASGLGTPVANKLLPDLAGDATVTGRAFQDNNADGVFNGTDTNLSGQTVYLDLNNNGTQDPGEPTGTIAANGRFTIADAPGGVTGTVRLLDGTAGYVPVGTAGTFTTVAFSTTTAANLALFPTAYATAANGAAYTLQVSPTASTQLQVLLNGTVAYTAPINVAPILILSFNFSGTGDSLAVDFGNGNPVRYGGISVTAASASNNDTLSVLGTAGNDQIQVNAGTIQFDATTITFAAIPNLSVDPRGGLDTLDVNAGTVTLPAQTAGGGILARDFVQLLVNGGATLVVATAAAHADRTVVVAEGGGALAVAATGRLDLGGNDLIEQADRVSRISALAATGFNGGLWNGYGLASSAAAANAAHTTALGVIQNVATGNAPLYASFDGVAVSAADVMVKYTYYGDVNLDGRVNAADYTRADAGFVGKLTGWANGDVNYDGTVDGTDYALIDNTFNQQSSVL